MTDLALRVAFAAHLASYRTRQPQEAWDEAGAILAGIDTADPDAVGRAFVAASWTDEPVY